VVAQPARHDDRRERGITGAHSWSPGARRRWASRARASATEAP
jgi:hypothetical protein